MKYGKIYKLVEGLGDFVPDPLNAGFAGWQYLHGDKAGAAGMLGYNAGEVMLDKIKKRTGKAGSGFGKALVKAKQRMQMGESRVSRAALMEVGDWEKDPNTGRMIYKPPDEATLAARKLKQEEFKKANPGGMKGSKGRPNTISAMRSEAPRAGLNTGIGFIDRAANNWFFKDVNKSAQVSTIGRRQIEQANKRKAELAAEHAQNLKTGTPLKPEIAQLRAAEMQRLNKTITGGEKAAGEAGIAFRNKAKMRLKNIQAIAAKRSAGAPIKRYSLGGDSGSIAKGAGVVGAMMVPGFLGAATKAFQNVNDAVQSGAAKFYSDGLHGINMLQQQSDSAAHGNLRENVIAWVTRKRKYGPSGRKPFKFDFTKPSHVKKVLKLGNDSDAKKMMKSTASITKHEGMTTKGGVPIKYAYASNNRKHLYAGKTIGMRQNIISQHKKLGLPLPHGFENASYEEINSLFKKRLGHGWYKRNYAKASIPRKVMIGVGNLWKKTKKLLGIEESDNLLNETANFVESAAPAVTPQPAAECIFMEGKVVSPMECDCVDCLAVTRRVRESEKPLAETAETSFGQNLRAGVQDMGQMFKPAVSAKKVSKHMMIQANKRYKKPLPAGQGVPHGVH